MRTLDPQSLTQHVDRLYRAAWALCGSREDAEDLVQETFARVLSRPRVLHGDDELYYLMRVLRNTFLTSLRTASRRPVTTAALEDVVAADPKPTNRPEQAFEVQEIYATIASCPTTSGWRSWRWTCSASPTGRRPAPCACARRRSRRGCSARASRSPSGSPPSRRSERTRPGAGTRSAGAPAAGDLERRAAFPSHRESPRLNGKSKDTGGVLFGEGTS